MSNVQECINLYLTDEEVTDAQFRAVIADAQARDLIEGVDDPLDELRAQLAAHGHALVLLNRIDDVRRKELDQAHKAVLAQGAMVGSLSGKVRVLRERLDNLEGK